MRIANLTPHSLTLVGDNGTLTVPPSGSIARLTVTRTAFDSIVVDGVLLPVNLPIMGDIVGLPGYQADVILVVSALVAGAANRADVMSPGNLLRDAQGNVVGAEGLCAYVGGVA